MEINEYQKLALRTANFKMSKDDMLLDGLMGLNGEAGECIDILKKHLFQGHTLNRVGLINELGDVSWYLAITAHALGISLEEIFEANIAKLRARYPHGFSVEKSVNRHED